MDRFAVLAVDSFQRKRQARLLFLAHWQEILQQPLGTFRKQRTTSKFL